MTFDVVKYWDRRYRTGGRSGERRLAEDRLAERYRTRGRIISEFARQHDVSSVLDIGSGDGHQAAYLDVAGYLGVDPSIEAVQQARRRCPGKAFSVLDDNLEPRDLHLSLEVIFHLVDDRLYRRHLELLFSARRFVAVWSTDFDESGAAHVRHRRWTDDVPGGWQLLTSTEYPPHALTFWGRV